MLLGPREIRLPGLREPLDLKCLTMSSSTTNAAAKAIPDSALSCMCMPNQSYASKVTPDIPQGHVVPIGPRKAGIRIASPAGAWGIRGIQIHGPILAASQRFPHLEFVSGPMRCAPRDRFAAGYGRSPLRGSLRLSKTALLFVELWSSNRVSGHW